MVYKGKKNGGARKFDDRSKGDAMQVDVQNGIPTNAPRACHKCGKPGHVQKDCRQKDNVNQNTNTNPNNGSQKCPHCHQTNPKHSVEQCYSNPDSPAFKRIKNANSNGNGNGAQNKEKKPPQNHVGYVPEHVPQYHGEQMYCQICNSSDHAGSTCTYPTPHLYHSTMVCRTCCLKGHESADCRHPNPVNCKICHKSGHKAESCQDASAAFYKQGSSIVNKDERFRWGSFNPNATAPGPKLNHEAFQALLPQCQLECQLAEAEQEQEGQLQQRGSVWELPATVDQAWLENAKQGVADKSIVKFPGQTEPLHYIPLRHANTVPASVTLARPFKVTKSHSRSANGHASVTAAKNAQIAKWHSNVGTTHSPITPQVAALFQNGNMGGMSLETFAGVYQRMCEEKVNASQKAVRGHIDRSTRLYRKQNYNTRIQRLANRIVEDSVLSDNMLLKVQLAMAQGTQFWRDPKAMEALVNNQQPVCHSCGHQGQICDGRIRSINPEVACADGGVAVLQIPDYEDWGVFVVFDCQCCNSGYSWVERPGSLPSA